MLCEQESRNRYNALLADLILVLMEDTLRGEKKFHS